MPNRPDRNAAQNLLEDPLVNPFATELVKHPIDFATHALRGIRAPGLARLALEWRSPWEHASAFAAWPMLKKAPQGDGHCVLVLPGFIAGDGSTWLLRQFLKDRGYRSFGWMQGRNLGPRPEVLESTLELLQSLHRESGRKVSIVGWSLGGIYAREIAKLAPDCVRCVISLGSPFAGPGHSTNAWWLFKVFNPDHGNVDADVALLAEPPPVPTTAIYSRTDGVVPWEGATHTTAQLSHYPNIENIEVEASHMGMGAHPLALYAVADRLAQAEGEWIPFDREDGWRKLAFRDPTRNTWFF